MWFHSYRLKVNLLSESGKWKFHTPIKYLHVVMCTNPSIESHPLFLASFCSHLLGDGEGQFACCLWSLQGLSDQRQVDLMNETIIWPMRIWVLLASASLVSTHSWTCTHFQAIATCHHQKIIENMCHRVCEMHPPAGCWRWPLSVELAAMFDQLNDSLLNSKVVPEDLAELQSRWRVLEMPLGPQQKTPTRLLKPHER